MGAQRLWGATPGPRDGKDTPGFRSSSFPLDMPPGPGKPVFAAAARRLHAALACASGRAAAARPSGSLCRRRRLGTGPEGGQKCLVTYKTLQCGALWLPDLRQPAGMAAEQG